MVNEVRRPLLDGMPFSSISAEDAEILDFEEDEIHNEIKNFKGDKAPGPDGFPLAFYQACWSIVKSDVLAICQEFYEYGQFEKSLNATFIVLIPKNLVLCKRFLAY